MKKEETAQDCIRAALMRHRMKMRRKRRGYEFSTVYEGNLCPVCHHRNMAGVVCRKYRGAVCMKHCTGCKYHQPMFHQCLFRESEPIDMRKWRGVCTHAEKDKLVVFLHENLLYGQLLREAKETASEENGNQIYARMKEIVAARAMPKYAIADTPDKYGNYSIADTDTGELLPMFAVYFEEYRNWTVVEYLPPGA